MLPLNNFFGLRITSLLVFLLLANKFIIAQDTIIQKTDDSQIQQQLENIAENSENEEADYTNLLDALNYYKEHPINLNKASREDLQELQLLSDIEINNLLRHIDKNGKLITIYELQGIAGFDILTIQKILPYVRVNDNFNSSHFTLKEMFKNGQNTILFRYGRILEQQTGFTDIDSASLFKSQNSRYIGSPDKLYLRYRFNYGTNVSWGITAEKDQGELFFKKNQRFNYDWYNQGLNANSSMVNPLGSYTKPQSGFDFYSAHLFVKNIRFVKAIAIGDYQATFGQGLTMWSGLAFGKSADVMNVKKSAIGLRPYTSVDENRFLRGAATTVAIKRFEATAFVSRKQVDANVSDTLETGEISTISSLQETGYHSTLGEIADKHTITQTIYGGNISYKGKRLTVGVTGVNYELSTDYTRALSTYNQFEFSSRQNANVGIDYNFVYKNFNFFGEQSMSQNGGLAFLNGAFVSLDPRLSLTMLYRNYQKNYQSMLSNGFAENTMAANEKGFFVGINAKPFKKISLSAYYDRFEFPWLKYQVNAPSTGNDYLAQINYTPSKKFDVYLRVRSRNKFKSTSIDDDIDFIVPLKQTNYRLNLSYSILPSLKLKNRVELIDYKLDNNKTQKGYVVYQDISYSKLGVPFSVTLRYALFQTDDYNSRVYAYENDMPGAYSIPAYYYKGSRFYVLLDYNVTRNIELWIRYSQTVYDNRKTISEGSLTEIQGNTRSEIKVQIRFKF
jgi:hypothetical protein